MMKYIFIAALMNILTFKAFSQSFEGKISFKLLREWISAEDSIKYYKLRTKIPLWKDVTKEEYFIGAEAMKKNCLTDSANIYMCQLYKNNKESFFMPMYSAQEINPVFPFTKLKYIKREREKENILGYECQKYKFESTIAGQTKIVYYWISNKFVPTETQENKLIDVFQPFGLILKRDLSDGEYKKFVWIATSIEQRKITEDELRPH